MSACAVARAAVAAASTVSHACGTVSGPPAPPACARMRGQAGSRAVLLRSRQRTQADRPGSTSGPTTPIASSACTTRCGTPCRIRSSRTTGSGRPVSTARSGSRPAVVGGSHLPRHPVDGAGDPGRPFRAHVGQAEPARGDVGRRRGPGVQAAHPRDAGRRQERRDAGADPARAVDPGERGPAAGEHRRPAVAVPVGERGAGQLGGDPLEQVPGQRRPAGRPGSHRAPRPRPAGRAPCRPRPGRCRRSPPSALPRRCRGTRRAATRSRRPCPARSAPGPAGDRPRFAACRGPARAAEVPPSVLVSCQQIVTRAARPTFRPRNGTLLRRAEGYLSATPATAPIGVAGVADRVAFRVNGVADRCSGQRLAARSWLV